MPEARSRDRHFSYRPPCQEAREYGDVHPEETVTQIDLAAMRERDRYSPQQAH